MCIESLYKNGLITGIVGIVVVIVMPIIGYVGVPEITADVSKKVSFKRF